MTATDLLRASRDGDQFHYHWAARQSLRLLLPGTDLAAIAIEGVAPGDTEGSDGEDVIDLAEYYGADSLSEAERVVYRQLKHSTVQADEEWTVSGLAKSVRGFAEKFRQVRSESPGAEGKVSFDFLSNRPVRDSVLRAIEALAAGGVAHDPAHPYAHEIGYLRRYAGFAGGTDGEALFFSRLEVDPGAPGLLSLESLFRLDVAGFLPGAPDVEHVLLKEMVARRATSLESDPVITRSTVLAALRTTPDRLLPAPNLIERPRHLITTAQTPAIIDDIVRLAGRPVIVHAAGGVGKSALTTQVEQNLPSGSVTLVYDCFGNGGYRRSSAPRHQHQQGLVQLSNELAGHALCDPLIPSATAEPVGYAAAFMARVRTAAQALAARTPEALLTIVIDAADNAALFAADCHERTFVIDLLREPLPDGVRLLTLCRTERIDLLNPPPEAFKVELQGFGIEETRQHVEARFGAVTDGQASEFHHRTGGNPRVQALVLEASQDIESCLASLGVAPYADPLSLDGILQSLVDKCKDAHHAAAEIDRLCEALATLRPRIPVGVLAELCAVPPALIHSFVADLGRPLLIDGDTLQFRDEPTETWFRTRCRPTGVALVAFIERLTPLAGTEPYVAVSLPQLLWEAQQVDTLVHLAMTDDALPHGNDLEQQEIAQQRAQFALKATLRAGQEFEASRLALKTASLTAGRSRRLHLLRSNTDLAGKFLDAQTIEDLVATRSLVGGWPGSNLHYEGALLSAAAGQSDFARSRLRSAAEWMTTWVRQSHDDQREKVTYGDIAEVAFGLLNTDGVRACSRHLARWRPDRAVFEAASIIAARLADAGRIDELEELGRTSAGVKYLQLAVASAAWNANLVCQEPLARRLVKMLRRQRRPISIHPRPVAAAQNTALPAVAWIVAMGLRYDLLTASEAERILELNLPKDLGRAAGSLYGGDTHNVLCGFALLARVRQQTFHADDVAGADVVEARGQTHVHSRALTDHNLNVVPLARWATLWIDCLVAHAPSDAESRFTELAADTLKAYTNYETPYFLIRGAARLGPRILAFGSTPTSRQILRDWYQNEQQHINTTALIEAVRAAAAVPELADIAVSTAELVRSSLDTAHESAEQKAEQTVALARATYRFDPSEARAHFEHAIDLTDRVGDDVFAVQGALLKLAAAAAKDNEADYQRAHRVAQLIEGLEPFLGDSIDQAAALTAIGRLSPTSAVAIASRWRDRSFCPAQPFIRALTVADNSPLTVPPLTALALVPLADYGINTLDLLEQALRHRPAQGRRIAEVIGAFLRPRRYSAGAFEGIDQAALELGIDLDGTLLAPGSRGIAIPPGVGSFSQPIHQEERTPASRPEKADLAAYDFTTLEGWNEAKDLVDASGHALRREDLIRQATSVPLAKIDDMVGAFTASTRFSVFDYATMVERLSQLPILPQAARAQIGNLARSTAVRFCQELATKSYDPIDLDLLAQLAGKPGEDLLGLALKEAGAQSTVFTSEDCYALAGKLAHRLPGPQAQVAFDDLTNMLEHVAPATDDSESDPHIVDFAVHECMAGYLWAALASPEAEQRWRAAHCVRLLTDLGCRAELEALHRLALGTLTAAPFADARLHFYDRHALQWLLFALARAAQDPATHKSLSEFVPLLKRVVFDDDPHVVIQDSARTVLLNLSSTGALELTESEQHTCQAINMPTQVIAESWRERADRNHRTTEAVHSSDDVSDSIKAEKFRFFLDFSSYWCSPLADAFGMSEESVGSLVSQIITGRWGLPNRGGRREDARHRLGLHRTDNAYTYRGEWPASEDLDFYLATHALWSVAADLVKTHDTYQDLDDETNSDMFTAWLARFLISRCDGRWLADRRDPSPDSSLPGPDRDPGHEWIWSLNSQHFRERLLPADQAWVTVWESSEDSDYQVAENVLIRSALVNPDRAQALTLALQTAPSYMGYRIPDANDENHQVSRSGFELDGWIVDLDGRDGQDRRDSFAASVKYPPPYPVDRIVRLLGLEPDSDMRLWTRAGKAVLRTAVWDDTTRDRPHDILGMRGDRLQIHRAALCDLLSSTARSLIVEVMIDRTKRDRESSYSANQDDGEEFRLLEKSFKIYLFDDTGGCREL